MKHILLMDITKMPLLPLQVKLGSMKGFVHMFTKKYVAFQIQEKHMHLLYAKLKEGIFTRPHKKK